MKLILVRHGNTFEANETPIQVGLKTDLPLTAKGLSQAKSVAAYLQQHQIKPTQIFAGQLKRQLESAQLIHQQFPKAKLSTHVEALNEIDYGLWEAKTSTEIESQWPQEYADWSHQATWPSHIFASQFEHHINALQKWLKTLAATQDTVVAVTSNGVMRLMLYFAPALWQQLVKQKGFDDYKVKTGHLCVIENKETGLNILEWNVQPG